MTVIQQSSIWDYLGQAGMQGVGAYADRRSEVERQAEAEANRNMQLLNIIMSGVNSGTVRAGDANANPVARAQGLNFLPSRDERAADIAASPHGRPEVAGFAPMPTMPGGVPMLRFRPWTPEQRITAGVPTQEEMFAKKFEPLQAELTNAAGRFVDAVFDPQIRVTDRNIKAVSQQIAGQAYQLWLEEQKKINSPAVNDPGVQQYAKSFFDQAVQARIVQERTLRANEVRASNSGSGGSDDLVRWHNSLGGEIGRLQRENTDLMKTYQTAMGMPGGQAILDATPGYVEAKAAVDANNRRISAMERGMADLASGRMPQNIRELQALIPSTTPAATATPAPVGTPTPDLSGSQIDTIVANLRQTPANRRQALFDAMKGRMSVRSQQNVASRLGLNP